MKRAPRVVSRPNPFNRTKTPKADGTLGELRRVTSERVSLIGGHLHAGPTGDGFAVHLWIPSRPGEVG